MTVMMSKGGGAPVPVADHRVNEWAAQGYVTVSGGGNAPVVAPEIALKQWLADYLLRAESVGIDQQSAIAQLMSGQASLMGGQAGLMNAETARLSAMLAARGPANWAQFSNQAGNWTGGGLGSHAALAGQAYPQGPGSWADMQTKAPDVSAFNPFSGASTGGGGGGAGALPPTSPGGGSGTWGTDVAGNQVTINRVDGSRDMDFTGYEGIGNPRRYQETLAQMYPESGIQDMYDSEGNLSAGWDEKGNPIEGEGYTGPKLPRMPTNEMEQWYYEDWVKSGAKGAGPAYMYPAPGESTEDFIARMEAAGHPASMYAHLTPQNVVSEQPEQDAVSQAAQNAMNVAKATPEATAAMNKPASPLSSILAPPKRDEDDERPGSGRNERRRPASSGNVSSGSRYSQSRGSSTRSYGSQGGSTSSRPSTSSGRRYAAAQGAVDVVKNPTTIEAGEGGRDEIHIVIPVENPDRPMPPWVKNFARLLEPGSVDQAPRRVTDDAIPMASGGMLLATNPKEISPGARVYDASKPFNLRQTSPEVQQHYGVKPNKIKPLKLKKGQPPGSEPGGYYKPQYVNEFGQSQQLKGNNSYRKAPAWQNMVMLDPTRTPAAALRNLSPRDIELNTSAMEAAGGDWATFAHGVGQALPPWALPRVVPRPRRGF